jgi:predicted HicB family RNase H-like nuclease
MSRRDDWVRIDVQMPPDMHEQARQAAESESIPIAAWIRMRVQEALARRKRRKP